MSCRCLYRAHGGSAQDVRVHSPRSTTMTAHPHDRPVPRDVPDKRPPAHSLESGAGIRRWPRGALVGLALLATPCLLVPIISRWRARTRLEAGDVCGPQSVVFGDPLAVAREELEEGPTPRARTTAAYALRVCRPPDAPLTAEELALLKRAATSDPDANVRVAATNTLLSVAGGGPVGEACLRSLEGDGAVLDVDLHEPLRDVCAHHASGACTVSHYVSCVLLRDRSAPGPGPVSPPAGTPASEGED